MEKKSTKKVAAAAAEPVVAEKKTATRKCACKKAAAAIVYNAETAGLRAGDIYQTLAAEGALTIKEIAKKAKLTEQETLLGMGWLLREGKLCVEGENVALA